MPDRDTLRRARKDKRDGKSASTQAGEFVRETIEHVREGKHGVRSTKQAIAIGLSKARRAGVKLPAPKKGEASEKVRRRAKQDLKAGEHPKKPSAKRSRASARALQKESHAPASKAALARQTRKAAKKRTAGERSASAQKAARTRKARREG